MSRRRFHTYAVWGAFREVGAPFFAYEKAPRLIFRYGAAGWRKRACAGLKVVRNIYFDGYRASGAIHDK